MGAAGSAFALGGTSVADKIKVIPCFSRLDDARLKLLAAHCEPRAYSKGDVLVQQGHSGDTFFLVTKGEVEVTVHSPVKEGTVYVGREKEGFYFGETSLLGDTPRTATVKAVAPAAALALNRREFLALCREMPEIKEDLMAIAASRLRSHLVGIPLFAQFKDTARFFFCCVNCHC